MSMEFIVFYSLIHGLVFCVIGGLASKLLSLAERDLNYGFGILLLFIIFEFGLAPLRWFSPSPYELWLGRRSRWAIYARRARWRFTFGAIIRSCGSHRNAVNNL
jgi:hypothetical protein